MAQPSSDRLHAFDALRGIMMMLGIVLHAAIAYSTMPTDGYSWHLHDQQRHQAFDVLIIFIHSFRIPLFFLLSGYFMHLVLSRKGHSHFVRGRIRRILVPFLLAFLVLTPLVDASFIFAIELPTAGSHAAVLMGRSHAFSWDAYADLHLMHLWFLYYLMLIYALVMCGRHLAPQLFNRNRDEHFASRLFLPVVIVSPTLLYFMESGSIDTPTRFVPVDPPVLLFYLMWFMVGWRLLAAPEHLTDIRRYARPLLLSGTAALVGHLLILEAYYSTPGVVPLSVRLLNSALAGVVVTCFCFGILGGFTRLFPTPNRVIGFLGESSYWSYLVHLPVVVVVAGIFQLTSISVFLKYPLVVGISSALVMASYLLVDAARRFIADRPFGTSVLGGSYSPASFHRVELLNDPAWRSPPAPEGCVPTRPID
jgi:glucans biosynthesis protein C